MAAHENALDRGHDQELPAPEEGHGDPDPKGHEDGDVGFEVEVIYDGVKKPFRVLPHDLVKTLLEKAIAAFGPLPNPHTLALYKGAEELKDDATVQNAGVKPHDTLLLRPSTVKGG
jgi:hypothetical protein